MLHILLLILKIIGITLAVFLGLVLLLVCIALFVPIRYKGNGQKLQEAISGQVKVTWLFHMISFTLSYKEGKMLQVIRVFGINLQVWKKLFRCRRVKSVGKRTSDDADTMISDKDKGQKTLTDAEKLSENDLKKINSGSSQNSEKNIPIWGRIMSFLKKIPSDLKRIFQKIFDSICLVFRLPGKIIRLFQKISLTFHNTCDKIKYWKDFLNDEKTRAALRGVKAGIIRLFKHILPKKVKGEIHYGFDDPCTTGQVLGVIYMLYPACQKHISICPDFEKPVLEGYLELKGRIYVGTLLWIVLKIYFDKNFKSVLNILLHKEEL